MPCSSSRVRLLVVAAPLGVPHDGVLAVEVREHPHRGLARVRSLEVRRHVLRPVPHRRPEQHLLRRREEGEGHHQRGLCREGGRNLEQQFLEPSLRLGGRLMHLPIASDESLAHTAPILRQTGNVAGSRQRRAEGMRWIPPRLSLHTERVYPPGPLAEGGTRRFASCVWRFAYDVRPAFSVRPPATDHRPLPTLTAPPPPGATPARRPRSRPTRRRR